MLMNAGGTLNRMDYLSFDTYIYLNAVVNHSRPARLAT